MLNMCQIPSLMGAAEGSVAEFSSLANFEEKKRKLNLLMSFPKTHSQDLSVNSLLSALFLILLMLRIWCSIEQYFLVAGFLYSWQISCLLLWEIIYWSLLGWGVKGFIILYLLSIQLNNNQCPNWYITLSHSALFNLWASTRTSRILFNLVTHASFSDAIGLGSRHDILFTSQ